MTLPSLVKAIVLSAVLGASAACSANGKDPISHAQGEEAAVIMAVLTLMSETSVEGQARNISTRLRPINDIPWSGSLRPKREISDGRTFVMQRLSPPEDLVDNYISTDLKSVCLAIETVDLTVNLLADGDCDGQAGKVSIEELDAIDGMPSAVWIAFSRVGFSDDGTKAFVAMYRDCPVLCGGGTSLLYLEKQNGAWTVADHLKFWVT